VTPRLYSLFGTNIRDSNQRELCSANTAKELAAIERDHGKTVEVEPRFAVDDRWPAQNRSGISPI